MYKLPSKKEMERNKEVSKQFDDCVSLDSVINQLEKMGSMIDTVQRRDVSIEMLYCTQPGYSKEKYDMLDKKPELMEEPGIIVRTNDPPKFYLVVGHIRAKKRYDNGKQNMPAYVIHTFDDSTGTMYENIVKDVGNKRIDDLEPFSV